MGERRRSLLPALLVALAAVAVHSGSLDGAFLKWDDAMLVSENPAVIEGGLSDLGEMLTPSKNRENYGLEYLPVRDLSNRLDRLLFGMDPWGYHLGNLIYFGLAAAALFGVLLVLLGSRRGAFLGALLFAVHPVATESVACIAHRKDVLMAAFGLLAWFFWLRERRLTALVLFVLAAFSKLPAIAFPPLILLVDLALGRRFDLGRILTTAALFAVAGTSLGISIHVSPAVGEVGWHGGTAGTNALSTGVAFLETVRLLLLPVGLHVGRVNETMTRTGPDAASLGGLAILLALAVVGMIALVRQRRNPSTRGLVVVIATLGFLILQAPYLQIRPFWILFAERYLLLAIVPLAFLVAHFLPRGAGATAGAAILLALLAYGTVQRERDWSDTITLFTDAYEKEPRSYIALDKVGRQLIDRARETEGLAQQRVQERHALMEQAANLGRQGRHAEANRAAMLARGIEQGVGRLLEASRKDYTAARKLFRRAVRVAEELRPLGQATLEEILLNSRQDLINCLIAERRWEDAKTEADRWADDQPDSLLARFFQGLVAQKAGRIPDAAGRYREAIRMTEAQLERTPVAAMIHYNLGILLRNRDGLGTAPSLVAIEKAVEINPEMTMAWIELARGYREVGRWPDVLRVLKAALEREPENPAILNDLAEVLERHLGRRDEAREYRRRLRDLARPR